MLRNFGLSYEETIRLHGHNGPFLAIGYQAGLYATKMLNPKDIMELVCRVEVLLEKPFTCIIDGIQSASCCTLGKGNLILEESTSKIAVIQFENVKTKKSIKFKLKEVIFERAICAKDLVKEASELRKMKPEELFDLCMS